jgi:hypothetical protein
MYITYKVMEANAHPYIGVDQGTPKNGDRFQCSDEFWNDHLNAVVSYPTRAIIVRLAETRFFEGYSYRPIWSCSLGFAIAPLQH